MRLPNGAGLAPVSRMPSIDGTLGSDWGAEGPVPGAAFNVAGAVPLGTLVFSVLLPGRVGTPAEGAGTAIPDVAGLGTDAEFVGEVLGNVDGDCALASAAPHIATARHAHCPTLRKPKRFDSIADCLGIMCLLPRYGLVKMRSKRPVTNACSLSNRP